MSSVINGDLKNVTDNLNGLANGAKPTFADTSVNGYTGSIINEKNSNLHDSVELRIPVPWGHIAGTLQELYIHKIKIDINDIKIGCLFS